MKKTKIIAISLLGLVLLVPFMIPTKAAPAYVTVAEEEKYEWDLSQFNANFGQFFTDNMSDVLAALFFQPSGTDIATVYSGWNWDAIIPQSSWPLTVTTISPENTSALLSVWGISDNLTYTQVDGDWGYTVIHFPTSSLYYPWTWYIVNDTYSFALQNIFGGHAFSPYMIQEVPFAPKDINWTQFAATCQWGLTNYWGGLAGNTTVTALSDGYSVFVPVSGFGSNTQTITINVSYNANSILSNYTFQYGALTLFYYELSSYEVDGVNPVTTSPIDFTVAHDYTGQSISWTATDANPANYTITRDATPIVTTTPWVSGVPVVYNITDGLTPGASHTFEITFTDNSGNSISDSVVMTVTAPDTTDPVITMAPTDLIVEYGSTDLYGGSTGLSFSWTATDANPGNYTIIINGSIVVVEATSWVSGTPVTYNLSSSITYAPGVSTYEITFMDLYGNSASDSVTITVNPIPTTAPPGIPGFDPLIIFGITSIVSISLIAFKKKKK